MSGSPRPVTPLSVLVERLAAVTRRAAAAGVDASLQGELEAVHALAAGLDPYVAAVTTPASPALTELARRTDAHDWGSGGLEPEMLSGHVEGRFLATMVAATGARRVLEIGMFTGYSALAMAEALPPDGQVVACELDPDVAAFARERFAASPAGERIAVRVGPAAETLAALADAGETFDLVFLDADKGGYADYLATVLDRGLLADGGLVLVDNTLLQGEPWAADPGPNGRAVARFNAAVAADPRVEQVVVPLRDGVTLIRRVDPDRGPPHREDGDRR